MQVVLRTLDGKEVRFDPERGFLNGTGEIPCFRCGVCCTRRRPQVSREEVGEIAARLGLAEEEFIARYLEPDEEAPEFFVVRSGEQGCPFLRREGEHFALCSIHEFKPRACRSWAAGLFRRECLEGLSRWREALLTPEKLYPNSQDREEFYRKL